MSDFIRFAETCGLVIDALVEGRWVRVKTVDKPRHRNGAYKFMGDVGFVQNHATMLEVATWRPDSIQGSPVNQRDAWSVRAQRSLEAEQRAEAIRSARSFWQSSMPLVRPHPYLERKGLSPLGCTGLRSNDGLLVVPVYWNDRITSVQTISADGQKRFWPGAPVKGGAYTLTRPRAALTAICEGLATGLTVYQSVKQASVVVAFDCGNLSAVAERLKLAGSVVIAADNDHQTEQRTGVNPGLAKARQMAESLGYGVSAPLDIEGTDWADALKEWGQGAGKRIEREVLAGARFVMT